ncbi:MAG: FkbM family methyltransferase [Chromatiaceae bacterium]|nr:FkbM family methyltransferase [Chromatiaceae bacterium]
MSSSIEYRYLAYQGPNFNGLLDDLGATSRVVTSSPDSVDVQLRTGDGLVVQGDTPPPTALKIDVEGFEKEVLEGLGGTLNRRELHLIGIEVHFGLLKQRGLTKAPREIEEMLKQRGFSLRWTDSSHLLAQRISSST